MVLAIGINAISGLNAVDSQYGPNKEKLKEASSD